MKKILFIACLAWGALSCNNDSKDPKTPASSDKIAPAADGKLDMPYTLPRPYQNWTTGDLKHAQTVMKSLKAFETGDLATCLDAFADSADIRMDTFHEKMSHDSLKHMFTGLRASYKSLKIEMGDYESVINSDKNEEWVTLWYKETWVDSKGKADSLNVVDDARMVNGKIAVLDEKQQRYPPAKK